MNSSVQVSSHLSEEILDDLDSSSAVSRAITKSVDISMDRGLYAGSGRWPCLALRRCSFMVMVCLGFLVRGSGSSFLAMLPHVFGGLLWWIVVLCRELLLVSFLAPMELLVLVSLIMP